MIDDEFVEFHTENPEVYQTLVRLARQAKARGRRKLGIGNLWEVMRWELELGSPTETYRLNNNYRSRYARLVMVKEPDLDGIFETRRLAA